jgi:hypothetical protein
MNYETPYIFLLESLSYSRKKRNMIKLYLIVICWCGCLFSGQLNAQTSNINADQLHEQLVKKLDKADWEITNSNNELIVVLRDSAWPVGTISNPYYNDEDWFQIVRNHPAYKGLDFEKKYKLTVRFDEKWSEEKWAETKKHNEALKTKMDALPAKYEIEYLKGSKGMYFGDTREENQRIMKYVAELETLHKEQQPLPDYQTSNHSIFVDDQAVFGHYEQHPEWTTYNLMPSTAEKKRWEARELVKVLIDGK